MFVRAASVMAKEYSDGFEVSEHRHARVHLIRFNAYALEDRAPLSANAPTAN